MNISIGSVERDISPFFAFYLTGDLFCWESNTEIKFARDASAGCSGIDLGLDFGLEINGDIPRCGRDPDFILTP